MNAVVPITPQQYSAISACIVFNMALCSCSLIIVHLALCPLLGLKSSLLLLMLAFALALSAVASGIAAAQTCQLALCDASCALNAHELNSCPVLCMADVEFVINGTQVTLTANRQNIQSHCNCDIRGALNIYSSSSFSSNDGRVALHSSIAGQLGGSVKIGEATCTNMYWAVTSGSCLGQSPTLSKAAGTCTLTRELISSSSPSRACDQNACSAKCLASATVQQFANAQFTFSTTATVDGCDCSKFSFSGALDSSMKGAGVNGATTPSVLTVEGHWRIFEGDKITVRDGYSCEHQYGMSIGSKCFGVSTAIPAVSLSSALSLLVVLATSALTVRA